MLILGWSYLNRTVAFHFSSSKIEASDSLKVMTFNVKVFNAYEIFPKNDYSSSDEIINYIIDSKVDVICLQEFYNENKSKQLNTLKKISKKTGMKYYFSSSMVNNVGAEFGMAIFSKLPIKDKGVITQSKKTNNQMMYLDVKTKDTTIRIYNIHLKSMSINENDIVEIDSTSKKKVKNVYRRLKKGFIDRSVQLSLLEEHIDLCPYPVLVCGDLNDLPYGNTYQRLKSKLNNAFEDAGTGFGFTYNGKIPFLRIDNIFYDDYFIVNTYKTDVNMKQSDHFPLLAKFMIKNKKDD